MSGSPKLAHPMVEVSASDFLDAVFRLPSARMPRRGAIVPRDTILRPDSQGVNVETPIMSTVVATSAPWRVVVSVDAKRLKEVCDSFKRIGAYKSPADVLALAVSDGQLKVRFRTTAVSIPLI